MLFDYKRSAKSSYFSQLVLIIPHYKVIATLTDLNILKRGSFNDFLERLVSFLIIVARCACMEKAKFLLQIKRFLTYMIDMVQGACLGIPRGGHAPQNVVAPIGSTKCMQNAKMDYFFASFATNMFPECHT